MQPQCNIDEWPCPFPSCHNKPLTRCNNLTQHILRVHKNGCPPSVCFKHLILVLTLVASFVEAVADPRTFHISSKDPKEAILEAMILLLRYKAAVDEDRAKVMNNPICYSFIANCGLSHFVCVGITTKTNNRWTL